MPTNSLSCTIHSMGTLPAPQPLILQVVPMVTQTAHRVRAAPPVGPAQGGGRGSKAGTRHWRMHMATTGITVTPARVVLRRRQAHDLALAVRLPKEDCELDHRTHLLGGGQRAVEPPRHKCDTCTLSWAVRDNITSTRLHHKHLRSNSGGHVARIRGKLHDARVPQRVRVGPVIGSIEMDIEG